MTKKLQNILESVAMQNGILLLIIFNSVLLGFMTSDEVMASHFGTFINCSNSICLVIFVLEVVLKLFVYRLSFFKDGWNIFDFLIVAISLVPTGGIFSGFRMLRTFRVFRSLRSLRMVSKLARLRLIVQAIISSLPSIGWTSLLLGIIYYIFSIVGVELFGDAFPEWFGSIGKSTYTLFQVMTLESWSMGISRPVMEVFPFAYLYFVPFILLTAFIVLNVVIGVVVNTISELSEDQKKEKIEKACDEEELALYHQYQQLQAQMEQFQKTFEETKLKKPVTK